MRHILIAVSGETPQIITETVYAMLTRQEPVPLSEIHVVTTLKGRQALQDHLLDPEEGWFWKLWHEYGSGPSPRFSLEETVHVLKDADGKALKDIRTSEENDRARRQIFDLVRRLTADPEVCLHGSIAGGRKSMGFLLGAAMQFFGRQQDRLYHVLVRPAQVEGAHDFFYIPLKERRFEGRGRTTQPSAPEDVQTFSSAEVRIDLTELSYLSVRDLVRIGEDGDILYSLTQEEIKGHRRIREEYKRLQAKQGEIEELIGNSQAMRRVKEQIIQIAETEATVVIQGETGTGKELVARAVHGLSKRKEEPFIPLNCGTLPRDLAEAELFGATKGSYTGSVRDREGAFKAANKGTLFLDEIGELSPDNQVKLLRALQEKKIRAVGRDEEEEVDVRIIAATHRNLEEMVRQGTFREDLFYRLNVCRISLPALRQLREDLPLLIEKKLEDLNRRYSRQVLGFSEEAMQLLMACSWQGNVRQLENVLERVVIQAPRAAVRIRPEELPPEIGPIMNRISLLEQALDLPMEEAASVFEKVRIMKALDETGGKKQKAAEALGRTRQWLDKRIKALELEEQVKGLRPGELSAGQQK